MNQELFEPFGGEEKITRRMLDLVVGQVQTKRVDELALIERNLNLPKNALYEVYKGERSVDVLLFQQIAGPLDLDIHDALGEPSIEGQEAKWQKFQSENPIFMCAPCGGEVDAACTRAIAAPQIDLSTFLKLKAMEELVVAAETA